MNKVEFSTKVKCVCGKEPKFSDLDWYVIEYVYNWHPSIDAVRGKEQIAYLYAEFGISVIEDMLPRAQMAKEAEERMNTAYQEYETAKKQWELLKQRGKEV